MDRLTITLRSDPAELAPAAEAVEAFCLSHGMADRDAQQFVMALDELLANVMEHGYEGAAGAEVTLTVESIGGERLEALIVDGARPFNPLTESPPPDTDSALEDRPVGGLGVHLARTLLDGAEYKRDGDHNRLRVWKSLLPLSPPPGDV